METLKGHHLEVASVALAEIELAKVVLDEEANAVEVVVPTDQLSLAIGRRGQNVRLASQLTGYDIDILTEEEESERRQKEFRERSQLFIDALDVDETLAQLLVTEGFTKVEELAYLPVEELAEIEGFDGEIAMALQERAHAFLEEQEQALRAEAAELGIAQDLLDYDRLELGTIVELGRKGIKSLEELADLAGDELDELVPEAHLGAEEAGAIIMDARVRLGWIEPPSEPATAELAESEEA